MGLQIPCTWGCKGLNTTMHTRWSMSQLYYMIIFSRLSRKQNHEDWLENCKSLILNLAQLLKAIHERQQHQFHISSLWHGEGNGDPLHDWATSLPLFTFMHWRRKWQPTPVFLPGESHGRGSLVGCHLWGHDWCDLAAAQQSVTSMSRWTAFSLPVKKSVLKPSLQACFNHVCKSLTLCAKCRIE